MFELNKIHNVDARVLLGAMESGSVDSIVTDPPAGISFMGKEWDHHKGGRDQWIAWMQEIATECLRALKPGGHALVWALPRTSHWTATAWENAGFEVRDRVAYLFGSGFPKSLDVSKAIDKEAGAERRVVGQKIRGDVEKAKSSGVTLAAAEANRNNKAIFGYGVENLTEAATDLAKQWDGWGTGLKPACEDWWLLRKPVEGTIAQNVAKYGTGAINVDGCRVEGDAGSGVWGSSNKTCQDGRTFNQSPEGKGYKSEQHPKGRWPANVIHDGSEEVLAGFPKEAGAFAPVKRGHSGKSKGIYGDYAEKGDDGASFRGDSGSAARFFYTAKASRSEREEGLEGSETKKRDEGRKEGNPGGDNPRNRGVKEVANHHPTVKPLALMEYLVRLITPPKGIVLDPFAGSGTTCGACIKQGFQFIACEKEAEYVAIAEKRIERWRAQGVLDFDQTTINKANCA